jgi:hypothetical protein
MIKKVGSKYCLFFSDGRKECGTKTQMLKREKQVQFFKHKGEFKNSVEYSLTLGNLGILAEYNLLDSKENIFISSGEDQAQAFLEKDGEVFILDSECKDFKRLKPVLDEILQSPELIINSESKDTIDFNLSEAFIDGQLIKGSHTHSVSIDSINKAGYTSENFGHTHFVDLYGGYAPYVGDAPIEINGIKIRHTHFIHIDPKGKK